VVRVGINQVPYALVNTDILLCTKLCYLFLQNSFLSIAGVYSAVCCKPVIWLSEATMTSGLCGAVT